MTVPARKAGGVTETHSVRGAALAPGQVTSRDQSPKAVEQRALSLLRLRETVIAASSHSAELWRVFRTLGPEQTMV